MIRVLIAEDNFYTRTGTALFLRAQPGLEIVGEAEDGEQAIAMWRALRPDVLVLDLRMPKADGRTVTATIRAEEPTARILILSHHLGDEDVFGALKAGARGYLTKDAPGEQLVTAITTIAGGGGFLPPEVSARLADHMQQPTLTRREREVLERLYDGRANKEIATSLGISERTTAMYVSSIMAKLGAKSRTEAVTQALERGIIRARR